MTAQDFWKRRDEFPGPRLFVLLLSLVAGWALYRLWPWLAPADDPLRSTAAVVPAVAVALAWLGGDAARRSGRSVRRASWLELALVVAVVASLPFRYAFGWAGDDAPWAAALVLALCSALRRRLLDLRPLLRPLVRPLLPDGDAGRVPVHFFLLPLVIYLAIQPWALETRPPDGDEPYYLLIAHSLAFDFDTDLSNQYADGDSLRFLARRLAPQTGDPVARDGSQQSRHSAFLPSLIAGPYAVAGRAGAAALMAVLSAALAWQCLRLARRTLPSAARGAFAAWACLAFLPPLLLYAHQLWVEVPAALLVAMALDRLRLDETAVGPRPRDLQIFGVIVALLPLLKVRFALLAASLLLVAILRLRGTDRRRGLWLVAPSVAAVAALLAVWWWRFGNPLKLYTRGELATLTGSPGHHARGLLGLFYDCAFGLFAVAPLWTLLLPGLAWLLRSAPGRRLAGRLALIGLPYLLAVAPRLEWYGGWGPPFRYAVVLLPLLALVLARALAERRRAGLRFLMVLLGVPTLLLTLSWVVSPPWTYNLADGYSHLLQQAGVLLAADVGRLFPSLVRPRLATWVWIIVSLLVASVAAWRGGKALYRRWAGAAGLCAVLLLGAALPPAAQRIPTGHVEVEDLWVAKLGGIRHPGPWRQRRPEAAGGWLIGPGMGMEVPAVAGGRRAMVEIRLLRFGSGIDTLYADLKLPDGSRQSVGSWRVRTDGEWRNLTLGPVDWPPGARLVLYHPDPYRDERQGLVVDWLDFRWLPGV